VQNEKQRFDIHSSFSSSATSLARVSPGPARNLKPRQKQKIEAERKSRCFGTRAYKVTLRFYGRREMSQ
jgi:hypothetical protein